MEARIIKVSEKGQISIPVGMRTALGIEQGDDLLVLHSGNAIILQRIEPDDFRDLRQHAQKTLKRIWSTKADDHWDSV